MGEVNTIKAAIFDMDGLLFDTERLFFELSRTIGKEIGWEITDEVLYLSMGKNNQDIEKLLYEKLGAGFPFQLYVETWRRFRDEHIKKFGVPQKRGVREILAAVKKANLACALATSSRRESAVMYLTKSGLLEHFAVIVGGEEVKRGKPEPDIFLKASSLLGVTPSACLVFEDSENGIKAGSEAGMRVIHIPDLSLVQDTVKNRIFRSFDSLEEATSSFSELLV